MPSPRAWGTGMYGLIERSMILLAGG